MMEAGRALPRQLANFFTRYPPAQYSAKFTGVTIPLTRKEAKLARAAAAAAEEAGDQSRPTATTIATSPLPNATSEVNNEDASSITAIAAPTPIPTSTSRADRPPPNPFMPFRNPETGRWRGAAIGLRRQAQLVKLAKQNGMEELLPPGRKSTAFKEQRILTRGLRVKGTGEGQSVKGHKWERQMGATLDKRRTAMEEMPALVREWKQRGHGRGWKKYPK